MGDRLSLAMDPKTAANFLVDQGTALVTQRNPDAFLSLLSRGEPPYPGQMTSILLALKTVYDAHREVTQIDRLLAHALHLLAMESHQLYEAGRRNGVQWPLSWLRICSAWNWRCKASSLGSGRVETIVLGL